MKVARNLTVILFWAACKAMLYVYLWTACYLCVCDICYSFDLCIPIVTTIVSFWTVNLYFNWRFEWTFAAITTWKICQLWMASSSCILIAHTPHRNSSTDQNSSTDCFWPIFCTWSLALYPEKQGGAWVRGMIVPPPQCTPHTKMPSPNARWMLHFTKCMIQTKSS